MNDGRYDVVLDNSVAAQFLGLLAASLTGDSLLKGRSLLAGKEGSRIVSPLVSLVDDGTLPRGLGSAALDDEGCPCAARPWWSGECSRASSSIACGGAPGPGQHRQRHARLFEGPAGGGFLQPVPGAGPGLAPGVGGAPGRGLVICDIMGGHTADPVSGEFSFGAAGFLVEKGSGCAR